MAFSKDTTGRSWMVTVQIKNMIKAGLTEEQYKNPEILADCFIKLWENSGKGRKAGIAVCESKDGLYHAHMACYGNTTTLKRVSDVLFQSHVDPVLGTKRQLLQYLKKEGKYAEKEEKVLYVRNLENVEDNQGKRNDLDDIDQLLEDGYTPKEILTTCFRYRKYESMIKSAYLEKRIDDTPLIKEMWNEYHWGATGTGKTYIYKEMCDKYSRDEVYLCSDYANSNGSGGGLDKYMEKPGKILVLDEFRDKMPYSQLLTILDVYSDNQIHCRYQNIYALWTSVIICTILPPDKAYEAMVKPEDRKIDSFNQLLRRLNKIVYHYKNSKGEYKTFEIAGSEFIDGDDMRKRAEEQEKKENPEPKQIEMEDILKEEYVEVSDDEELPFD